jgi:hypothetical protein
MIGKNSITNGDFSLLPNMPGVYNWYYPFKIFNSDTYEDFHQRVSFFLEYSMLDQGEGLFFRKESKWREWHLTLKTKILAEKSLNNKWDIIKSESYLVQKIEESSMMFQPLYVGCAQDLSKRIQEHLSLKTGFSKRFKVLCEEFKVNNPTSILPYGAFEIEHLHLTYTVLDDKKHITMFEDVIQSFSNPILSIK